MPYHERGSASFANTAANSSLMVSNNDGTSNTNKSEARVLRRPMIQKTGQNKQSVIKNGLAKEGNHDDKTGSKMGLGALLEGIKSLEKNLNVNAKEFVPRSKPRNTSYLGILEEQKDARKEEIKAFHFGVENYGINEILSDAVATLMIMPSKFDRTTLQFVEKCNKSISDIKILESLVDNTVQICISEVDFRAISGRFCSFLANNVQVIFEGKTFNSILEEKLQILTSQHKKWLTDDPETFRSILMLFAGMYYWSFTSEGSITKLNNSQFGEIVKKVILNSLLLFYHSSLTIGIEDEETLNIVAETLKLIGKSLQDDEVQFYDGSKTTTFVFAELKKLVKNEEYSKNIRNSFSEILNARNVNWQVKHYKTPSIFNTPNAQSKLHDLPRKYSRAIKIVNPTNNNYISAKNLSSRDVDENYTPDELKFMADEMDKQEFVNRYGSEISNIEEQDSGMPDDVAEAYEKFCSEQNNKQT